MVVTTESLPLRHVTFCLGVCVQWSVSLCYAQASAENTDGADDSADGDSSDDDIVDAEIVEDED